MANISFLLADPDSDSDRHLHRRHRNLNHDHYHHPALSSIDPYSPIFPNQHSPLDESTNFNVDTLDEYDDVSDPESVILTGPSDLLDRENQASFVMDLFQQRVEQSRPPHVSRFLSDSLNESCFGVIDENSELDFGGLDLDSGVGFESDSHENSGFRDIDPNESNRDVRGYCDNIIVDNDDFFVNRRVSGVSGIESYEAKSAVCFDGNPIRVVGFDSDSDSEECNSTGNLLAINFNSGDEDGLHHVDLGNCSNYDQHYGDFDDNEDEGEDDDVSFTTPLCWDSLRLEDHRESNEDLEWEEVDGRVDEREVLSVFVDDEEAASVSLSISPLIAPEDMVTLERVGGLGNLGWEVLLDASNLGSNAEHDPDHYLEPYFGEHDDDDIYASDYETLFGQFAENEIAAVGHPPAAKSVVERLPSVVLTKEDVDCNALCAVCKDDIGVGETAKQLPCLHRYHGECILPWLGIRNTCPVCRYELRTDDPEYERRRAHQRSVADGNRF